MPLSLVKLTFQHRQGHRLRLARHVYTSLYVRYARFPREYSREEVHVGVAVGVVEFDTDILAETPTSSRGSS